MAIKLLTTVFATVFLAELGDKAQLATLLYSAEQAANRMTVFVAASSALVVAAAVGVLAGGAISQYVSPAVLKYVAGAGFIAIGIWTMVRARPHLGGRLEEVRQLDVQSVLRAAAAPWAVLGLVILGRLPRFRPSAWFDPRFTNDRFGVAVHCPPGRADSVRDILTRSGADEVQTS